jgi:hypothetical protein
VPTDQLIPPVMPGFEDRNLDPLDGSVEKPRSLVDVRTRTAVMAVSTGCGPCRQEAEVVRANLGGIGIEIQIKQFPDPFAATRRSDAKINLWDGDEPVLRGFGQPPGADALAADALSWLPRMSRVERPSRRDGVERPFAAMALADKLATREVPPAAVTPVTPPSWDRDWNVVYSHHGASVST